MTTRDAGTSRATLRVGVFDAGVGGLPFAARLRQQRPDVELVYLADAARRPYGPRAAAEVATFLAEVTAFFDQAACDVWVVACNTASVVADQVPVGQARRIDMVEAAARATRNSDPAVPLGVLATAGTVRSGAIPRSLGSRPTVSLATEELLRLAETGSRDHERIQRLAGAALHELQRAGCAEVLLACTDYTCVLDDLESVAGRTTLLDPLEAALDLTLEVLPPAAPSAVPVDGRASADRLCLTGPHPLDVPAYARERFDLELPPAELVTLPTPEPASPERSL